MFIFLIMSRKPSEDMPKDMAASASEIAKVLFENDKVKVVELKWKTGAKIPMHTHPTYFAYALTSGKYKSRSSDGKIQTRTMKKGKVQWYDAESHAIDSMGKAGQALIVELK
jgi:quercetin dioxygenase-like cupin family protein